MTNTSNGQSPANQEGQQPTKKRKENKKHKNASKESKESATPKCSKQEKFPVYMLINEVQDGLKNKELIKGAIRISTKSSQRAFITNDDDSEPDYLLQSELDRNRALEGDIVAVQLKPEKEWTRKQKTVVVVHILERVHSRITVGHLEPMPDNNRQFAMLIPRDYRVPKIRVPVSDCPSDFYENRKKHENTLFKGKISSWSDVRYAVGSVLENIGLSGDLQAETVALLVENDLDVTPFPLEMMQEVEIFNDIPETELLCRRDLRKECIFTIDPLTAHDLDDAISCTALSNGNFEIGVHIADVSFYLKEDTSLDKMACKKATTIYLLNNVYHMLPYELCRQCSFTPGSDKLAFSIFWEITRRGEILRHYFARTVMNSCAQLAYEHAEAMIEDPNFRSHELPQLFGGFTYKDVSRVVNHLQSIAVILRRNRFASGALRINRTRVTLKLDDRTGEPSGYCVYEYKEANKLVEEFMLLANTFVAQKIVDNFRDQAFLRCHPPPNQHLIQRLKKTLEGYYMDIDINSSKMLQFSILKIQNKQKLGNVGMAVLHHLIAKAMRRAEYFCSANTSTEDFRHYALAMPIYTHFTSPIRRYADVVVHRLLASSLGYIKKRQWKLKHLAEVATNCNRQKFNARSAGDASNNVYLARYIFKNCPFIQDAAVVGIGNNYLEVLIPVTGTIVRIYPKKSDKDVKCSHKQHVTPKRLELVLPKTPKFEEEKCIIQIFSVLQVILYPISRKMQFRAKLWRPINVRSLL